MPINLKPPERYTSRLPVCRVTPTMRQELDAVAERTGLSACEIQRRALELFLSIVNGNPLDTDLTSLIGGCD